MLRRLRADDSESPPVALSSEKPAAQQSKYPISNTRDESDDDQTDGIVINGKAAHSERQGTYHI